MKLNTRAFALTCGILWALVMLLMTVWAVVRTDLQSMMGIFSCFYFGYSVSWLGAVIGAVWGFIDGAICGLVFAWLYNRLADAR